ncbi:hypothetical protein V8C42DRAFT_256489 [Trichoderma barbatum]
MWCWSLCCITSGSCSLSCSCSCSQAHAGPLTVSHPSTLLLLLLYQSPFKHAPRLHWPAHEPLQRYFQEPGLNLEIRFASLSGTTIPLAATTKSLHRLIAWAHVCRLNSPLSAAILHDAPRFGNARPKPLSRTRC